MPRPLRIQYPGAIYHVMARGNQGQSIYKDDKDRFRFLDTLAEACEKTGWRVYAYVLMHNHYHLLISTPEGNLVAGMKWLQGTFTQRCNGRHKKRGHLFQGRYKALVMDVEDANYTQIVSTYIHLNPVRAGLVADGSGELKKYRWSSYPAYLALECPAWLSRFEVLGSIGLTEQKRRGYEAYMEGRVLELRNKSTQAELEEQWMAIRRGWYLGKESFANRLQGWIEKTLLGKKRESHSGGARETHDKMAVERLVESGMESLGLNAADLAELPLRAPEKIIMAWWLRKQTTVSLRWVAERLSMGHYTAVTQAVHRVNRAPSRRIAKLRERLLGGLGEKR